MLLGFIFLFLLLSAFVLLSMCVHTNYLLLSLMDFSTHLGFVFLCLLLSAFVLLSMCVHTNYSHQLFTSFPNGFFNSFGICFPLFTLSTFILLFRSVHTNYSEVFTCDTIKLAVLKNPWLAAKFKGNVFDVMFRYEKGISSKT